MLTTRTKLLLAVGFGAGYVLGTRAGRQRYQQISELAQKVANDPRVRDAVDTVKTQAGAAAGQATQVVQDKLGRNEPPAAAEPYPVDPIITG